MGHIRPETLTLALLVSCSAPAPSECTREVHYSGLETSSTCAEPHASLSYYEIECVQTFSKRDPVTCYYEAFGYCEHEATFTVLSTEGPGAYYYAIVRFRTANCENRYLFTD